MPIFILGLEIISEFVITNEARVILVFLKPKNYHNCRVTKRLDDLSITTLPIHAEKEMKWSLTWFMGICIGTSSEHLSSVSVSKYAKWSAGIALDDQQEWHDSYQEFYRFTKTQGLFETRQFRHKEEGSWANTFSSPNNLSQRIRKMNSVTPCKIGCLLLS